MPTRSSRTICKLIRNMSVSIHRAPIRSASGRRSAPGARRCCGGARCWITRRRPTGLIFSAIRTACMRSMRSAGCAVSGPVTVRRPAGACANTMTCRCRSPASRRGCTTSIRRRRRRAAGSRRRQPSSSACRRPSGVIAAVSGATSNRASRSSFSRPLADSGLVVPADEHPVPARSALLPEPIRAASAHHLQVPAHLLQVPARLLQAVRPWAARRLDSKVRPEGSRVRRGQPWSISLRLARLRGRLPVRRRHLRVRPKGPPW